MGWDPWKDVTGFVSDIGEDIGDFAEDIWKSDVVQIGVPAAAGFVVAGPAGAVAGAGMGYSSVSQKKAVEEAEKLQEKQIAAQKEMQEKQIEFETLKIEEAKELTDVFTKQDQPLYIAQPDIIVTPAPVQAPVNYLLYIAIGIGILIYLGKIKL